MHEKYSPPPVFISSSIYILCAYNKTGTLFIFKLTNPSKILSGLASRRVEEHGAWINGRLSVKF
jgi:hypothetical protein